MTYSVTSDRGIRHARENANFVIFDLFLCIKVGWHVFFLLISALSFRFKFFECVGPRDIVRTSGRLLYYPFQRYRRHINDFHRPLLAVLNR